MWSAERSGCQAASLGLLRPLQLDGARTTKAQNGILALRIALDSSQVVEWSTWSKHGFNFSAPNPNTKATKGKLVEFWMWRHLEFMFSPHERRFVIQGPIPILACKTTWALAGSVSCKPPATPTSPWQLQRIARDTHDIGCRLVMTCMPKLL